jgi:regulator of cell morphogenesis and NO signaling
MNFNTKTRVNEIALSDPGARRVLEDAGVDYCCGGGKSLHDACMRANVPAEVILEQLRQNSKRTGTEESGWKHAPLAELTRHIRERHHGYVRDVIPRLREMLAKVREKHGSRHREVGEIEKLFGDIAREMQMHMQKEEQILFPYVDALERAASGQGAIEPPFKRCEIRSTR